MNFPTAKNGHLFTIKLSDELSPRISSQIRRGSLQIVFLTSIYDRDCQREQSLEGDCQGAEWPQDYMYQLRLCTFCISYPISLIHSWSVKANTKLQIESYDSISIPMELFHIEALNSGISFPSRKEIWLSPSCVAYRPQDLGFPLSPAGDRCKSLHCNSESPRMTLMPSQSCSKATFDVLSLTVFFLLIVVRILKRRSQFAEESLFVH